MGAGIIGTIVRPCPPPVPPLFPLALIGGVSRGRGGPVRTLMRRGKMLPFLYAPLFRSYRPIRCSNGFRNHYQNYSPTTSPSRPSAVSSFPTFGGLSGDGEVPAQTIVRKGKRLPFGLIPLALVVPVSPMRARNKVSLAPWSCYMLRCDGGA